MKKIVKWIMMACLTLMCTACDDNGPLTYEQMLEDYEDEKAWARKSLVNIAKAGYFSSDRTIEEYNNDIWHLS